VSGVDVHLRDLRYFVAVAEELHFGRAAERLFISQPALSRQIAKLERDLRAKLLDRDRRSVALTPAGTALLAQTRGLLADWDTTRRVVSDRAAAAAAVVRLGMQTSIGRGIVATLQESLARRNPSGRIELVGVDWNDPTVGLASGQVDLAVGWLPLPRPDDFNVVVVATEDRHVAVAAGHALATRDSVTFADIEDQPIIALPESAGALRDFWLALHQRSSPPVIAAVAHSAEEALEAVASGIGIVLLSEGNADIYRRDQIVTLPVTDLEPSHLALIARASEIRLVVRDLLEGAG